MWLVAASVLTKVLHLLPPSGVPRQLLSFRLLQCDRENSMLTLSAEVLMTGVVVLKNVRVLLLMSPTILLSSVGEYSGFVVTIMRFLGTRAILLRMILTPGWVVILVLISLENPMWLIVKVLLVGIVV